MSLRHTLLGLLADGPTHGYRLRKQAREYSWIYPMTNASIYPALHELEQAGFISHHSEIHNGRARKVYAISDAGRDELRRWLCEPTEAWQSVRDQMVLKIAMQNDESLPLSRAALEGALDELKSEIEHHRQRIEEESPSAKYARLTLRYGAELLDLRRRFFEQVLAACEPSPARANFAD
jgi:PadR family transcriptional regulator AphA